MRILVWQWGRRGAGPSYAAELARSFGSVPATEALLSLSAAAELLSGPEPPHCALPVQTYSGLMTYAGRVLTAPLLVSELVSWLRARKVDVALCAMPAALDLAMATALRQAKIPYAVVVHDADLHPGDFFPPQIQLQRLLVRGAAGVFALSTHVARRIEEQQLAHRGPVLRSALPPMRFATTLPRAGAHRGKLRLLSFGRLLPYKGLDLLADALGLLGQAGDFELRVVGNGPESRELARLRALPGVSVENRWVPEREMTGLLGWADALVLSHREASQSGVAAAAVSARRWIISTRVGGLEEQLASHDMALLCEPRADSIAQAIRSLIASDRMPPEPARDPFAGWAEAAEAMVHGLGRIAVGAEAVAAAV